LFPGLTAGSLPRFIATCPGRPGLTVGSALDRGPDRAEGAITRSGRLVTRQGSGALVRPRPHVRLLVTGAKYRKHRALGKPRNRRPRLAPPTRPCRNPDGENNE